MGSEVLMGKSQTLVKPDWLSDKEVNTALQRFEIVLWRLNVQG